MKVLSFIALFFSFTSQQPTNEEVTKDNIKSEVVIENVNQKQETDKTCEHKSIFSFFYFFK